MGKEKGPHHPNDGKDFQGGFPPPDAEQRRFDARRRKDIIYHLTRGENGFESNEAENLAYFKERVKHKNEPVEWEKFQNRIRFIGWLVKRGTLRTLHEGWVNNIEGNYPPDDNPFSPENSYEPILNMLRAEKKEEGL